MAPLEWIFQHILVFLLLMFSCPRQGAGGCTLHLRGQEGGRSAAFVASPIRLLFRRCSSSSEGPTGSMIFSPLPLRRTQVRSACATALDLRCCTKKQTIGKDGMPHSIEIFPWENHLSSLDCQRDLSEDLRAGLRRLLEAKQTEQALAIAPIAWDLLKQCARMARLSPNIALRTGSEVLKLSGASRDVISYNIVSQPTSLGSIASCCHRENISALHILQTK